ncbi:MAG: MIP family channel protein [Pseudomonadota bacterium]
MNRLRLEITEFIGTFIMVFAGTSAIVINDMHSGVITHLGIAIVFGLVVAAVIYSLGEISGAHINPAVTIAFWLANRFPGKKVLPYIIAQILGAITASLVVSIMFMEHATLGATIPSGSLSQSFILEIILTFILMLTIINVATGSKEQGIIAGVAIGSVVALEALFAGPVSGASMNPARSIGPALISGNISELWIYIIAPIIGASLSILCCRCIREEKCCTNS